MSKTKGEPFLAYENRLPYKVYLACSIFVPTLSMGRWSNFIEHEQERIQIKPYRYLKLPTLVPFGVGKFASWAVFDRKRGGEIVDVILAPGMTPSPSMLVGPDGRAL